MAKADPALRSRRKFLRFFPKGARAFAEGLYDYLHRPGDPEETFDRWATCAT